MYKRVLTFIFSLLLSTSIFAMDLNKTIVIINEATQATKILQDDFNTLINEESTPNKVEVPEINSTLPQVVEANNSVINVNKIIDINNTKNPYCKESNESIILNGLSINLEQNNTISDNACIDSNLGTSAEGLIIFKTKIKPYCKINGDKFAKQYIQEDWDDIYHDKEFKMEIIKACPKMETRYRDEWTPHLYQFTLEYASDSDAIPEC